MRRPVLCVMLTTLCLACSAGEDGDGRREQNGTGGGEADAGGGGHTSDAACGPMDGGAQPDAAVWPDAGDSADAGWWPDAGGGEADAGPDPFPDAGSHPDAGGHW